MKKTTYRKTKLMKICFFSTTEYKCLKEQYTLNDIRILEELGFQVIYANKLKFIPLDCDIYFSWWVSGSFYPLLVALLVRKPIIVIAGGNEALLYKDSLTNQAYGYLAGNVIKKVCVRLVLSLSTRIVGVSQFMVKDLTALGSRSLSIIENCVDTNQFVPDKRIKKIFVTTSVSINEASITVKRLENLIYAAGIVLKQYPLVKFLIIGNKGDAYVRMVHLLSDLGINNSFTFTNSLDANAVVCNLQQSLCFVQPSDTETFGVAVAEAMSVGCPVVVSRRGALPEIVGHHGVYVDQNSPASIADGIMSILKMRSSDAVDLGLTLRARIDNFYSYGIRKQKILELISTITTNK